MVRHDMTINLIRVDERALRRRPQVERTPIPRAWRLVFAPLSRRATRRPRRSPNSRKTRQRMAQVQQQYDPPEHRPQRGGDRLGSGWGEHSANEFFVFDEGPSADGLHASSIQRFRSIVRMQEVGLIL